MTLNQTHPKLVNFLQQLTQQPRVLSYREMSKSIRVHGKKISVKTIQHWMNTLRGVNPDDLPQFFYYPAFYNEAIGLTAHQQYGSVPERLKRWMVYSVILHNYKEEEMINTLLLPTKNTKFNIITTGKTIYNLDGTAPEKDYDAIFREHFRKCEAFIQLKIIRKNPLILPCIFEYQYRSTNALQAWGRFKDKIGRNINDYCPRIRTVQQGVHAIRKTLRVIQPLIVEPRVECLPFNKDKDYYYIMTKRIGANILYKYSTSLRIYKTSGGYLHVVQVLQDETEKLLELSKDLDVQNIKIVMKNKTEGLLKNSSITQFQYEKNYDPKTGMWKET